MIHFTKGPRRQFLFTIIIIIIIIIYREVNAEGNSDDDAKEARRKDRAVAAVERDADRVSDLLRVAAAGARALRALEALGLLLEEHPVEDGRVVYVAAVRADPLALPEAVRLGDRLPALLPPPACHHFDRGGAWSLPLRQQHRPRPLQ